MVREGLRGGMWRETPGAGWEEPECSHGGVFQPQPVLSLEAAVYLVVLGTSEVWVGWCLVSERGEDEKRRSKEVLLGVGNGAKSYNIL